MCRQIDTPKNNHSKKEIKNMLILVSKIQRGIQTLSLLSLVL